VELQSRYADIQKQGLGLVAVSYDSTETLKQFADSRGITFPMVSDPGSAIIKRYGLLNDTVDPKSRSYGIPHPGTFMLDAKGIVTSRYFEDAYQERSTVGSILVKQGHPSGSAAMSETTHLKIAASVSDEQAAPGKRLSLVFAVTPKSKMHVYAPGKHSYQVITIAVDPQPWLKVQETMYPASAIYDFKPLNEKVEVYSKPFTLMRDVTVLATTDAQKFLATLSNVTITGSIDYQACDEKLCYSPTKVPFSFTLAMKPLDRKAPAGQ
jgi:hypothetical protein